MTTDEEYWHQAQELVDFIFANVKVVTEGFYPDHQKNAACVRIADHCRSVISLKKAAENVLANPSQANYAALRAATERLRID